MVSKSKNYAFRLHPNDQREADAMEIIEALKEDGFTLRDIMTDAILRAGGRKPEMYRHTDDSISRGYIETQLEGIASHIISELRASGVITQVQATESRSPFGADEDEEMARNLVEGWKSRKQRGNQ